jgi:hypothetical protein
MSRISSRKRLFAVKTDQRRRMVQRPNVGFYSAGLGH